MGKDSRASALSGRRGDNRRVGGAGERVRTGGRGDHRCHVNAGGDLPDVAGPILARTSERGRRLAQGGRNALGRSSDAGNGVRRRRFVAGRRSFRSAVRSRRACCHRTSDRRLVIVVCPTGRSVKVRRRSSTGLRLVFERSALLYFDYSGSDVWVWLSCAAERRRRKPKTPVTSLYAGAVSGARRAKPHQRPTRCGQTAVGVYKWKT